MKETPIYICKRTSISPAVNGRVDKNVWESVQPITFVSAQAGAAITKSTIARMCWDTSNLYIAFECADTDIWGTLTRHDDPIYTEDVVEAFLNPSCDLEHYFEFEVSPLGVLFDAKITNRLDSDAVDVTDVEWDCEDWRVAVLVDGTINDSSDVDSGWTVEMAIPFASLGVDAPKPGEKWRANLYRIDRRPEPVEHQAWSPTLKDPAAFHVPQRFGTILFK